MKQQTKEILKRVGAVVMVFISGGNAFLDAYLLCYPPTHANAAGGEAWKIVVSIATAIGFGYLALRPKKRPRGIPIVQVSDGTRLTDAEGHFHHHQGRRNRRD